MNKDNKEIYNRIHLLETTIKGFKAPQFVGTDSVRTYTNLTNNEWDDTWVSVSSGGFGISKRFRVRFKAAHQDAPFGRIRVIADFNGVKYDPRTNSNAYLSSTQNFMAANDEYLGNGFNLDNPMLEEFEDPRLLRFEVRVSTLAAGITVRLKYIVDATDTGRIYTVQ
jgi:hypothetical protein